VTQSAETWNFIMRMPANTVNQTELEILDVRSGSDKNRLEGNPYSDW
jgi:hypothetical protein